MAFLTLVLGTFCFSPELYYKEADEINQETGKKSQQEIAEDDLKQELEH